MPDGLLPKTSIQRRVAGLRDYQIPSDVKVFSATTGELLRIEHPNGEKTITKKQSERNHD